MGIPRTLKLVAFATATALLAGACVESTAIGDGMGEVQITLGQTADAILSQVVAAPDALASNGSMGRVDRTNIESLVVVITGIQLLPYCEEASEQNGDGQCEDPWISLPLEEEDWIELDLMALPTEGESPIVIAAGSVPVGEYHKVRLFVNSASVVFIDPFSVGRSDFVGGEPYDVEIPSAQNTGIKADIDLVVEDDGEGNGVEVGLLFDPDATIKGAVATGNGRVKMPPVLKFGWAHQHQNEHQNQNG
jgi:hypothetical protein